ncbi:hypothetical protein JCM10207_005528 [Rhodosporidiobolus poonsookiae]
MNHPSPASFLTGSPAAFTAPTPAAAASAFSPPAFAPSPAAAAAARPSPLPPTAQLAVPRSTRPPASARTGPAQGLHVEDPQVEARRAVGVLLGAAAVSDAANGAHDGVKDADGLLDRVQRDVDELFDAYEHAFDGGPAIDPSQSLASLTALLSLLSRSAAGGFVPPSSPHSAPLELSAAHLEAASKRAQDLFREVQRVKEGAEVVRAGLSG